MKRTILILALWLLATPGGTRAEPPVTRLIYRPTPASKPDNAAVNYPRLLAMMEKRCNPGLVPRAKVRQLDGGRIEVDVSWQDLDQVRRIDRALHEEVTLEVRVLASATSTPNWLPAQKSKDQTLLDAAGKRIAWWAPVPSRRRSAVEGSSDRVSREARGGIELLALADGYALSAADVRSAWPGMDDTGRPSVAIGLSQAGAQRLNKLIGEFTPDPQRNEQGYVVFGPEIDVRRYAAVVINGSVYETPAIKGKIDDSIQICASDLSCEDVEVLAGILDSGPMPVRLEQTQDSAQVPGPANGPPRAETAPGTNACALSRAERLLPEDPRRRGTMGIQAPCGRCSAAATLPPTGADSTMP